MEATIKPDASLEAATTAYEIELLSRIQQLETQLAMEKLLLDDQRAANLRQQQQVSAEQLLTNYILEDILI